jgi:phosphatidylserine decarboxylase
MAREGFIVFIPCVIIMMMLLYVFNRTLNINYAYWAAGVFFLGALVSLFFRDPDRKIPQGDDLILSPADGKIMNIDTNENGTTITIFLSVFNVHINRVPVDGIVKRVTYKPGKFLAAFKESASIENERNEIEIETPKGNVIVHQIAGLIARRVVCRLKEGQTVKAGDRLGLIRFGSRVDIFLPPSAIIEVKKGQKVNGALTILGILK